MNARADHVLAANRATDDGVAANDAPRTRTLPTDADAGVAVAALRPARSAAPTSRWLSSQAVKHLIVRHHMLAAAAIGGIALIAAWWLERIGSRPAASLAAMGVTFVTCGAYAMARAWESLRRRDIGIHFMMLVGAVLAVFVGHPIEGALLLFLFVLSTALEDLATGRAERAVQFLGTQFPAEALVDRDGERIVLPLPQIVTGDRLIVRPGDRVACDGEVIEGTSHVDESMITGEFMPRSKSPGSPVYAGSLNGEAALYVRVTRPASESTLAKVAELVQSARRQKTRLESLIDRVGRHYGPIVLCAALLMTLVARFGYGEAWSAAVYRAIAMLIVASPCALVLATPVPVLAAIATAARSGIVAKGGIYFERLATARRMFFDKTGTLTTGRPRLAQVASLNGDDATGVLRLAAELERDGTHPLAEAIREGRGQASGEGSGADAVDGADAISDIRIRPGLGVTARMHGSEIRLGRCEWAAESLSESQRVALGALLGDDAGNGRTTVLLAAGAQSGLLWFDDTERPGAAPCIQGLRAAGIRRIELLTGDRHAVGRALAERFELDAEHSQLLPADKLARIDEAVRSGEGVVMIGDGVNDAPALARADVGIAMGGIGSHTALDAADFVLLHDRVEALPGLVRLARATQRVMLQNVIFAMAVIVLLAAWVALAERPILSLSVVGHEGSTLLVVLNGLRVLSRPKRDS